MKIVVQTLLISSLAVVAFASPSAMAEDTKTEVEQTEKPKKITDRRHPDYVRCRSEPIIGSLSRKRRICMTNKEWVEYTRTGSRDSKEFVDDNQPGFMMTP